MAPLRARRGVAAVILALIVPAVLAGACTISSESPDAGLGGRSGPASGTTTTAGDSAGASEAAATTVESADTAPEDAETADDATSRTTFTTIHGHPRESYDRESPNDEAAGQQPEVAAGDRAGSDGEPTGTAPADEVTADPPDTGTASESGDGVPVTEAVPATETADTPAVTEGAFDERSKVSTVGIGAVYFGMSPEEAAERVGTVWAGIPAGGSDCYVMTPSNGPPGVALWVYHGTVERVDVDTPLLRTQSGLGVGTHLGELRSLLGNKLVVEEHPYLAGWILATFVPTDPNDAAFRIAFDISGGEVIRFRAGRTEIVSLEACA